MSLLKPEAVHEFLNPETLHELLKPCSCARVTLSPKLCMSDPNPEAVHE